MKTTRTILATGVVFSILVLVGCSHTVEVVVHNPTDNTFAVKARGPGIGVKALGSVAGNGGKLRKDVSLRSKDLPASLTIEVGKQELTFTITGSVDQIVLGFERDKLIKIGKDPINIEIKTDTKTPITDPEEIVD